MSGLWTPPVDAPVETAWEWRYEASLALVGVATLDGRVLVAPRPREARQWVERLPVPVMAFPRVSRPGDGQGGVWEGPLPVATISEVELRDQGQGRGELIGRGRFDQGSPADHYRGALAVDAVCFGVELDQVEAEPMYRATAFSGWRLRAAMLMAESAWDRSLLTAPRVWRAPVGTPW